MKTVYKLTDQGWESVQHCQSFSHACKVARELEASTGVEHPMTLKSIVKFVFETLVCMAIGMIFAILFYNAL